MLIYLARPNDHAQGAEAVKFGVACAERALRNHQIAWYDPIKPFGSPMADPVACWSVNEAALKLADAALAIYPPGVPSTGTPMEIQTTHLAGKPVAVVGGNGSMQLMGMGVARYDWDDSADPIHTAIDYLKDAVHSRFSGQYSIKYVGDEAHEPRRGYPGDAGFDLIASEDRRIHVGNFVDVPCGISVELPYDCWAMITGRSSTLWKRQLLVHTSIIDQGYRGPIFAGTWNLGENVQLVEKGERIAQIIPMPLTSMMLTMRKVEQLNASVRGVQSFGSTGG